MKRFFNGYFYKAAIGIGLVVLVGLIAADIWLWQSDDDSSSSSGSGQGTSTESNVPGLPSRGGDANSSGATVSDSVNLEIQREGQGLESGLIANDGASVGDVFRLETTGSLPGSTVNDAASIGDSVVTQIQPAAPPPSGGGTGVKASVGDSATIVVEDADGNIKQQEEVK